MSKKDLTQNNFVWLMSHKTKQNQIKWTLNQVLKKGSKQYFP